MRIIEMLLNSDPAVKRLTKIYLLDKTRSFTEEGWINDFLIRFNHEKKTWGNGIYGPKWISTFYTMRDLRSLEIDPNHPIYIDGLNTLVTNMWNPNVFIEDDICVVAMLVGLLSYSKYNESVINEMITYLMNHQLSDGGWNCASVYSTNKKASISTTLCVLEAYADYERAGYTALLEMIKIQIPKGQMYLLNRKLMRRETNQELILPYIDQFHFPTRWKYDVHRALCYFTSIDFPYDDTLKEGLDLLKTKFSKGYLNKGVTYSGRLHFKMENSKIGMMNTLRGLMVLKKYDNTYYQALIENELTI